MKLVKCDNCSRKFKKSLKRYNESQKNKWKCYCSKSCLVKSRRRGITCTCSNPECNKIIYRQLIDLEKYKRSFCSRSCSAKVTNQCRVIVKRAVTKNKKEKIIQTKTPKFIKYIHACANEKCVELINIRRKYCSNLCHAKVRKKSSEEYKSEALLEIKSFYKKHKRIPLKREMLGLYKRARYGFGTWNNAIREAGFKPNPVMFSRIHTAIDGHRCDSFAEKIIDDWLHSNLIYHQVNIPYPGRTRLTCDFVIGDTWIEFFGLNGQVRKYDKLVLEKLKIAKRANLNLVKLYPEHLFPVNLLDDKLDYLKPKYCSKIQLNK